MKLDANLRAWAKAHNGGVDPDLSPAAWEIVASMKKNEEEARAALATLKPMPATKLDQLRFLVWGIKLLITMKIIQKRIIWRQRWRLHRARYVVFGSIFIALLIIAAISIVRSL
jgi:hypothetical protein